MQIKDLFAINDRSFLQAIPKQYRSSLTNIKTAKDPSPHDYFAYIIFSGDIPIGCIVYHLFSNFEKSIVSYELEVCYIRVLEHLVSVKASEYIEKILITLPALVVGFNINLIRCSILDNNLLYPTLCAQLVKKNWVCCGSFKLIEYDPFSNSMQWKIKLRQLELIYFRMIKHKFIEIANFDSLSDVQRNILTYVDAPQWSKPFNSSLCSTLNSRFSYVIFRKQIPLSWVIADKQDSNSLFVETSWFNPSITSSAAVFSLFYLIFKEAFGWNGLKGEKSFSFRFLTNNRSMHNLDEWLTPFLKKSCFCQSYDVSIEQI